MTIPVVVLSLHIPSLHPLYEEQGQKHCGTRAALRHRGSTEALCAAPVPKCHPCMSVTLGKGDGPAAKLLD